jgi:hypothetical protein
MYIAHTHMPLMTYTMVICCSDVDFIEDADLSGLQTMLHRPLVALDFETTGKHYWSARACQVGMVKLLPDGDIEVYVENINPQVSIPPDAFSIHGITDAQVSDLNSAEAAEIVDAVMLVMINLLHVYARTAHVCVHVRDNSRQCLVSVGPRGIPQLVTHRQSATARVTLMYLSPLSGCINALSIQLACAAACFEMHSLVHLCTFTKGGIAGTRTVLTLPTVFLPTYSLNTCRALCCFHPAGAGPAHLRTLCPCHSRRLPARLRRVRLQRRRLRHTAAGCRAWEAGRRRRPAFEV